MALPNYIQHVHALAEKYPQEWREAHTSSPNTEAFIRLLASYLHYEVDANVGLNGKRGNPNDISDDALAIIDPQGDVMLPSGQRIFVVDVIAGAGGPNPTPAWQSVGGPSPGAWVQPAKVHTPTPIPIPTPTPAPPPNVVEQRLLDALTAAETRIKANDDADHQTLADLLGDLKTHLKQQDEAIVALFTAIEKLRLAEAPIYDSRRLPLLGTLTLYPRSEE
jgi:hypothetical protein